MPIEPEAGGVLSLVSPKMLRFRLAALAAVASLKKKEKEAPAPPPQPSTTFGRVGSFAASATLVMSEDAERAAGECHQSRHEAVCPA